MGVPWACAVISAGCLLDHTEKEQNCSYSHLYRAGRACCQGNVVQARVRYRHLFLSYRLVGIRQKIWKEFGGGVMAVDTDVCVTHLVPLAGDFINLSLFIPLSDLEKESEFLE